MFSVQFYVSRKRVKSSDWNRRDLGCLAFVHGPCIGLSNSQECFKIKSANIFWKPMKDQVRNDFDRESVVFCYDTKSR